MPNDNQAAKSYIEAVMARADGATEGPWEVWDGCSWRRIGSATTDRPVILPIKARSDGHPDLDARQEDLAFIAASRQDIPTLAKMLLRAIAGLNEMRIRNSWAANVLADELLAEINAMAKGSQ